MRKHEYIFETYDILGFNLIKIIIAILPWILLSRLL